jgi:hypothetical protein
MKNTLALLAFSLIGIALVAQAGEPNSDIAADAQVYFISPSDGQVVTSPFAVKFGLKGMGIAPAGIQRDNTGHHHLLINTDVLPNLSMSLPATDKIRHFGGGHTETELTLPPGEHTLQLLMGNFAHIPHAVPVLSDKITITVE